jgi:cytochrome P450
LPDIYLNPQVTKGQAYEDSRLLPTPSLFDTLDHGEHSRKRRIVGRVLSEHAMRSFETTMSAEVDEFLRELLRSSRQGKDEVVDMSRRCQRLSADVICQLGFGYPLKTQTDATNRPLLEAFTAITGRMALYINWPATFVIHDPLIDRLAKKASDDFRRSIESMVKARMELDKDAKFDLYNVAMNNNIKTHTSEDDMIKSELWAEAVFFITAGTYVYPGL